MAQVISEELKAIKGMPDILPDVNETLKLPASFKWEKLENSLRALVKSFSYQEIRLPILEKTALFNRTIGKETDIVSKEMYSFLDRNGISCSLRPEGTAGCVRSCIEHNLLRNGQQQRLWYMGTMYRYEAPQEGRYRQFYQFGVESFNISGPEMEAEHLLMMQMLWVKLEVKKYVKLEINTLGSLQSRKEYLTEIVKYFTINKNKLDKDSLQRLEKNPLRILDSKNIEMQELIHNAPKIIDYVDQESKNHFEKLQNILQKLDMEYTVNHRLVRGLDYYNKTVYEWVTNELGSQSALCGGGRYDDLVQHLGGVNSPAVGFSLGLDRVLLLVDKVSRLEQNQDLQDNIDLYMICYDENAYTEGLKLAKNLRTRFENKKIYQAFSNISLNKQFKKADKSGAQIAVVLGEQELENNLIGVKYLRNNLPQSSLTFDQLVLELDRYL